jgi:hypothetical protein
MPPDALLLIYAGLAGVAAADPRLRDPAQSRRTSWLARGGGALLLALSAGRAVADAGAGPGTVAWIGSASVLGLLLVLLLSRWPRAALGAALPAALLAAALACA